MNTTRLLSRCTIAAICIAALALMPAASADTQEKKIPERTEIDQQYLWATENIYPSDQAWEEDFASFEADLKKLAAFQGRLSEGPHVLLDFFKLRDEISPRFERAWVYASLRSDEDTRVSTYQGMKARMRGLAVEFGQAVAWFDPEMTAISWDTLEKWFQESPKLALYRHALEDLFRQKTHVLSQREEELMALAGQVMSVSAATYNLLTNADIKFPTIKDEDGNTVELYDQGFYTFLRSTDRRVRRDAYFGIVGTYADFRNTAAALLNGEVQTHIFSVRARNYESCLQAALDGGNIPVGVYDNLINTVNDNLPLLHRYQSMRREYLDLKDGVHAYDLFAPFTSEATMEYTYEEGVDTVKQALAPLGKEYGRILANGIDSRWIDVYPTRGKRSGAYSSGTFLTQPYILLNYAGSFDDVSTMAHELGHSMHSYFSRGTQPYVYSDYDIFCAEVASITNEILLQHHVLERITDPETKLFLLTELLESFRGTVFRQTMFSEFEQRIHEMGEAGIPLTADSLGEAYGKIMRKYYGPDYTHDELVNDYWIRIPHFYYNFYVYKYATSYCAAANIAARVLAEEPGAVEAYLNFLKSGSSKYPVELLQGARVDMTTPAPIESAMKYFEDLLDQTEQLLDARTANR